MTNILTFLNTIIGLALLTVGCDTPTCKNTNSTFDKYAPDTKEYKDELVKQLATVDKSKLTYWMDTYQEDNNSKYINALIQGDGLCAKIVLTVNDSGKGIEDILKNKGKGYHGAQLEDLKYDIKQDSTSIEFVFQEISGIVD